jgi:hypothetical protein
MQEQLHQVVPREVERCLECGAHGHREEAHLSISAEHVDLDVATARRNSSGSTPSAPPPAAARKLKMDSGQDVCFSSEYTATMEPHRWWSSQSFLLHPDVKEAWPPMAVLANPIYFFLPFHVFFDLF